MLRREFLKAAAAWVVVGAGLGEAARQIGVGPRVRTYSLSKVTFWIGGTPVAGVGLFADDEIVLPEFIRTRYITEPIEVEWHPLEES